MFRGPFFHGHSVVFRYTVMSSLFDEFTVFMSSFVMKLKRVHCVTSSPVAILKVSVVYPEKY